MSACIGVSDTKSGVGWNSGDEGGQGEKFEEGASRETLFGRMCGRRGGQGKFRGEG